MTDAKHHTLSRAIILAMRAGWARIAQIPIEHGVELEWKLRPRNCLPALVAAIEDKRPEMVRLLLSIEDIH
jgi:hypothetical protein